jgi:hypothetical protein
MRRLEVADLSLATLDALDVDAIALLVGPERPLQGLAGLVDWRLCGALTRALTGGLYQGAPGEALLLPTAGHLPVARVVAVGLPAPNRPESFGAAARRLCEVLAKAGIGAFAAALPPVEGADGVGVARLWLEAVGGSGAPAVRQVLLGDARTLLADLSTARTATGAPVELATFTARPAPMVR